MRAQPRGAGRPGAARFAIVGNARVTARVLAVAAAAGATFVRY